jgi:ABC-type multidrug transport system permease subunit
LTDYGHRFAHWFLPTVMFLVALVPMSMIFLKIQPVASNAVWYGLWPGFLCGVFMFAFSLPDKHKNYKPKINLVAPIYAIFMVIGSISW